MVTLAGDVVAFGVRANQFQLVYETVAQLLAASDTIADGQIVQAGKYFYEGAGSGASDHHITNAGGSKLYCLANPYVTPDQFGAPGQGQNETSFVQAAIDSGKPVFLERMYDVTSVDFPANVDGIVIHGNAGANKSGLNGTDANSECILQTFTTGSTADSSRHHLANFAIRGQGKRGLGICQIINSTIDNIFVAGPTKQAIIMELAFGNVLRNIETGFGARVDMQVGATVLDTIVDLFYTNNSGAQHHIYIDQGQQELARQTAAGHGIITFNMPTLQGADGYAIRINGTYSVNFTNTYFEANNGAVLVTDADIVNFSGCDIAGNNSGHLIWLGQAEGAITYEARFTDCHVHAPVVVDNGVRNVYFNGCRESFDPKDVLRTTTTHSLTGWATSLTGSGRTLLFCSGIRTNHEAVLPMQATDTGQIVDLKVAADGTITAAAAVTLAQVDHGPHEPVVTYPGTGSPTATSGVAMSSIQYRCVGGTAPYTWSIEDDVNTLWTTGLPDGVTLNSSGLISGTPTETGTFRWKVRVTDADGMVARSRGCSLTVS